MYKLFFFQLWTQRAYKLRGKFLSFCLPYVCTMQRGTIGLWRLSTITRWVQYVDFWWPKVESGHNFYVAFRIFLPLKECLGAVWVHRVSVWRVDVTWQAHFVIPCPGCNFNNVVCVLWLGGEGWSNGFNVNVKFENFQCFFLCQFSTKWVKQHIETNF